VGPEGSTTIEPHHTIERLGELLDIVVL
jgi:hypothetical protein